MNGGLLEVVVGSAPGWADPWSRGVVAQVIEGSSEWDLWLNDGDGFAIHDEDLGETSTSRGHGVSKDIRHCSTQ